MKTARQPDGKQNSIADLDRNKQGIIASYTRDHRASVALIQPPVGGWIGKIARAFPRRREHRSRLEPVADDKLSKGRRNGCT
jgi:hypothetical protein